MVNAQQGLTKMNKICQNVYSGAFVLKLSIKKHICIHIRKNKSAPSIQANKNFLLNQYCVTDFSGVANYIKLAKNTLDKAAHTNEITKNGNQNIYLFWQYFGLWLANIFPGPGNLL